ncbi:metallophosphoesterase family protein [Macrococcoides goetzii]|uniref:metallophosphoesterase family protein n=1 Tax=Macrococcus TaxID=69965 RepID=UPI001EF25E8C|nr:MULTISPECIES: metallophosphoesterase family protein [Macrococcus]MCG7419617.1 metallophosphoesterase family protein [Macrococcus epidermidis]MCH4984437.1 metallophosphoesterase family protein [Macrococcus sp. PK]MCH4985162.1 metallophosphoesterase family protein [Macrococcus sp. PK]
MSYKIIQLTDLHLSPHHNKEDVETFELISQMVLYYHPNLLMLTGDQIWSEGIIDSDQTYKKLIQHLNSLNVPVAITYGNHDTENQFTRSDLRALESEINLLAEKKHTYIVDDKEAYCIEVTQDNKLTHVIYVIDSGDYDKLNISHYDYIHPEHVNWIRKTRERYVNSGFTGNNNILFTHIPLPEYKLANKENGLKGIYNEQVSSADINSGMFVQLLHNNDVSYVSCGHDHDNDFQFNLNGINLCFGRVSGFHCYGDVHRGARMFELEPSGRVTTKVLEYDKRFK